MEIAPPRKLTFGEAVRRRPGMYVGNPGPEALQHLIDELVSNAIDQFLMGQATFVGVQVHDDGGIDVTDDGAGLPFDLPAPDDSASLATHWFTTPHHTARADDHAPHVHLHDRSGIGLALVSHCCMSLVCRSWRSGVQWEQAFAIGVPQSAPRVVAHGDGRGTSIVIRPDVGLVEAALPAPAPLRAQLWQAAHLFAGLQVRCNDEVFLARGGLRDLAQLHDDTAMGRRRDVGPPPTFHWHGRHGDYEIDAAASGWRGIDTYWRTWVNGRGTPLHGVHRDGFADALRAVGWQPATAMLHVVTHDPRYAHPTRDKYVSPGAREAVREALTEPLDAFCRERSIGRHAATRDPQR